MNPIKSILYYVEDEVDLAALGHVVEIAALLLSWRACTPPAS